MQRSPHRGRRPPEGARRPEMRGRSRRTVAICARACPCSAWVPERARAHAPAGSDVYAAHLGSGTCARKSMGTTMSWCVYTAQSCVRQCSRIRTRELTCTLAASCMPYARVCSSMFVCACVYVYVCSGMFLGGGHMLQQRFHWGAGGSGTGGSGIHVQAQRHLWAVLYPCDPLPAPRFLRYPSLNLGCCLDPHEDLRSAKCPPCLKPSGTHCTLQLRGSAG